MSWIEIIRLFLEIFADKRREDSSLTPEKVIACAATENGRIDFAMRFGIKALHKGYSPEQVAPVMEDLLKEDGEDVPKLVQAVYLASAS